MRAYKKESERLRQAESLVGSRCGRFGPNKQREIIRLLYEISKREGVPPRELHDVEGSGGFREIKRRLVQRRFPGACAGGELAEPHLPMLDLSASACVERGDGGFHPRRVIVESSAQGSRLVERFKQAFPKAAFSEIRSLRSYLEGRDRFSVADYNRRRDTAFIVSEEHDFFKRCPCTTGAVPCGYQIVNLGFGCIYDCAYCYLQGYVNSPGIVFPANIDAFLERFAGYARSSPSRRWQRGPRMRLGTGEFSDSLMLDDVTEYSLPVIDFFGRRPEATFEFKTKSDNIENLLGSRHSGNVIVAWSLSPQGIIDENELYTASLEARIGAAKQCREAGYGVAFHFDPILCGSGWEAAYDGVIDRLFSAVAPDAVAWISLGTLRFAPPLKRVIESRFPGNTILDGELLPGFDGKLRYTYSVRLRIYRHMIDTLMSYHGKLPLYLCMENKSMWRDLNLQMPFG